MVGLLLGDGILNTNPPRGGVSGGTYFKLAQEMNHFNYLEHVFDLFSAYENGYT
jgi:hypothetical protein